MKIFIIDEGRYETVVHMMFDKGGSKILKRLKGLSFEQAREFVFLVLAQKPEKIIIDDMEFGIGLKDCFTKEMSLSGLQLQWDGTVKYQ